MSDLTLGRLRLANVARCEDSYHPLSDWSLTDWACAAAGEMGEACNVVKKLRRLESRWDFDHGAAATHQERATLLVDLGDELADTVIYLDLIAARAGIDLGEAITRKFNRTSDRVGSGVRL